MMFGCNAIVVVDSDSAPCPTLEEGQCMTCDEALLNGFDFTSEADSFCKRSISLWREIQLQVCFPDQKFNVCYNECNESFCSGTNDLITGECVDCLDNNHTKVSLTMCLNDE